ncbi:MAG: type III pantothenate kinase [Candidatus Thioglobus sp.]|nr:MAG: type III pantothenate kinase [Candidatus Thioglobus sp.]KAA0454987.1 MAG: type III pantothenate kinase [Candidatus Thioglobus sp.]
MAVKNLLVDIGNSSVSWEFDGNYDSVYIENFSAEKLPKHQLSTISCVANYDLIEQFTNPTIIKPKAFAGVIFDYNLEQFGVDRFLGLMAGADIHPQQDFMLVDIGTFVTIDLVQNGKHIDGGIAPGLALLQASKNFKGADSKKSWKMGTQNMLRDYIIGRWNGFKGAILLTGGDKELVQIKQGEYYQNLVIEGLKIINE